MQFSNTTTKSGLIQMCETKTGKGDAGISGNSTLLAQFTAKLNRAYGLVLSWIFKVDKKWHFDDSNYPDFPISTTNIVENQRDYTLPDKILNIRQVEVMDASGNYYSLSLMSEDDYRLRIKKQQEDAGRPTHYYLLGNSIFIYQKTNSSFVTLTAGLRITFDRYADYFVSTDTTKQPGFVEPYHQILALLASSEYCDDNDMGRKNSIDQEIYGNSIKPGVKKLLEDHYVNRNSDDKLQLKRKPRRYK